MTARVRAGLAAATFAAAAILACGDPNAPHANFSNYADTLALYTLNGTPRGAPSAIHLYSGAFGSPAVATDGSFRFDVAVDIDAQGRPVLYPVRTIAAGFIAAHSVGILRATQPFDEILKAPTAAYVHDSATVLSLNEVVLLQSADLEACGTLFGGGFVYAKMVVDSVNVANRRVFVRITADPNCGFRSLVVPGVPTD
jgi:hypothetical protein